MSARDALALATEIRRLEERHLEPCVRASASELDALLADDFSESGASGRRCDKRAILEVLPFQAPRGVSRIADLRVRAPGENSALATYTAPREFAASGVPPERSLRSSIWERGPSGWRLVFHQDTTTGAIPQ